MIGIISFLIFLVLANILTHYLDNEVLLSGVQLLNDNFWLLLLIGIIFFVADVFSSFPFPLDLPAPIIRAFGCVFIIAFVLVVIQWLFAGKDVSQLFQVLSFLVVPLVFILVIVTGYYEIVRRHFLSGRTNGNVPAVTDPTIGTPKPEGPNMAVKSWEDVHIEFRMMIWDIIHRFRDEIHRK
jgi:hypothetical protein